MCRTEGERVASKKHRGYYRPSWRNFVLHNISVLGVLNCKTAQRDSRVERPTEDLAFADYDIQKATLKPLEEGEVKSPHPLADQLFAFLSRK